MSFQDLAYKLKRELGNGSLNPHIIIGIAVIALAILGVSCYILFGSTLSEPNDDDSQFKIVDSALAATDVEAQKIYVHVSGSVTDPKVVSVDSGSRVSDAIDAAGGFTAEAAKDSLNLARVLEDGEHIHVVSIAEAAAQATTPSEAAGLTGTVESQSQNGTASSGKININKATAAELQTLSGIGEAKAKKIIDYREANGAFKSIEELTKVSGIGDKTLESIKQAICV